MKIGVISDTHGFFDPQIPRLFQGVEHILHAGDIGPQSIILELEKLAPVTAVTGNTDSFLPYRETELIDLGGLKFMVHHIVNAADPRSPILARVKAANVDAVIFGHTHRPFAETRGHTLFFNPGSAGRKRFDLPRTVAILTISPQGISHEWIDLE